MPLFLTHLSNLEVCLVVYFVRTDGTHDAHGSHGTDDTHGAHGTHGRHGTHGTYGTHGAYGTHGGGERLFWQCWAKAFCKHIRQWEN